MPKPKLKVVTDDAPGIVDAYEWQAAFHAHFWPAYPRKVSKYEAARAWAKIEPRTEDTFNAIMDWLERASAAWRERAWYTPPNASTALHQRRWEDEDV